MSNIISLPIYPKVRILVSVGDRITPKTRIAQYDEKQDAETLHIAKLLSVAANKIGKYLKKNIGDKVSPGDILAEKKSLFSHSIVRSPINGKLLQIDLSKGMLILLKYDKENKEDLTFPISGKVILVGKEAIEAEVENTVFKGLKGEGEETVGNLRFLAKDDVGILDIQDEIDGSIILCKSAQEAAIVKFQVMGAKGAILMKLKEKIDLPWIQVEENTFSKLTNFSDKKVWLRPRERQIVILDE